MSLGFSSEPASGKPEGLPREAVARVTFEPSGVQAVVAVLSSRAISLNGDGAFAWAHFDVAGALRDEVGPNGVGDVSVEVVVGLQSRGFLKPRTRCLRARW